jgi:hypothetical protein
MPNKALHLGARNQYSSGHRFGTSFSLLPASRNLVPEEIASLTKLILAKQVVESHSPNTTSTEETKNHPQGYRCTT